MFVSNLVINKNMQLCPIKTQNKCLKKDKKCYRNIQNEKKYCRTACHLTWVLKVRILTIVINWMFLKCLSRAEMPQIQVSMSLLVLFFGYFLLSRAVLFTLLLIHQAEESNYLLLILCHWYILKIIASIP